MNNELLAVLDYIEQERGISRDVLIEAVEKALVSAARKGIHPAEDLTVVVDPETGEITAIAKLEVVEVFPNNDQIKLEEALQTHPDAKIGDIIEWSIPPQAFGRIAAQTAKQAIMHRLRMAEKEIVRDEYIDKLGQIINGIVRRFESGNMIIDFGKAEGIMRTGDKVRGEQYVPGDRINALLINVDILSSGPSLIVSRATPKFVIRLFEREVSEIHDGTVEIVGVAREAGNRTKIAVKSNDPRVDPVGACVGMRGMRVRNVTNELSGEKVDIIPFAEGTEDFAMNALSPAKAKRIDFDKATDTLNVYVAPDQSRLAFGKKGQNVRLSAKLLGKSFKIYIEEEEHHDSLEDLKERAAVSLSEHLGVSSEIAMTLVNNGFLSIDGLREADPGALSEIEGLSEEDLNAVVEALKKQ